MKLLKDILLDKKSDFLSSLRGPHKDIESFYEKYSSVVSSYINDDNCYINSFDEEIKTIVDPLLRFVQGTPILNDASESNIISSSVNSISSSAISAASFYIFDTILSLSGIPSFLLSTILGTSIGLSSNKLISISKSKNFTLSDIQLSQIFSVIENKFTCFDNCCTKLLEYQSNHETQIQKITEKYSFEGKYLFVLECLQSLLGQALLNDSANSFNKAYVAKTLSQMGYKYVVYDNSSVEMFIVEEDNLCEEDIMTLPAIINKHSNEVVLFGRFFKSIK